MERLLSASRHVLLGAVESLVRALQVESLQSVSWLTQWQRNETFFYNHTRFPRLTVVIRNISDFEPTGVAVLDPFSRRPKRNS